MLRHWPLDLNESEGQDALEPSHFSSISHCNRIDENTIELSWENKSYYFWFTGPLIERQTVPELPGVYKHENFTKEQHYYRFKNFLRMCNDDPCYQRSNYKESIIINWSIKRQYLNNYVSTVQGLPSLQSDGTILKYKVNDFDSISICFCCLLLLHKQESLAPVQTLSVPVQADIDLFKL